MTQPPSDPTNSERPADPGPFVPPASPAADAEPFVPPASAAEGYPPPAGFPPPGYPPPAPSGPSGDFPPPGQFPQPDQGGYPPPQQGDYPPPQQGGYPPQQGGYPPQQGDYPPPQQGDYPPPQQGGYPPPQQGGFPPQQGGFPPQQGGYPPQQGGFPPQQGGFPPQQGGYAPQQGGFPPQGGGSPNRPAGGASIDLSKVGVGDWVVIGLGVLLLLFSFFGWLSVSYSFLGTSTGYSIGGWNRFWFLAPLLILAVTAVYALQLLTGMLRKEVQPLWLLYGALAALVFYVISLIDIIVQTAGVDYGSADTGSSSSVGPGFGIWASIILALAFVYFLALSVQKSGSKLPFAIPGPKL